MPLLRLEHDTTMAFLQPIEITITAVSDEPFARA
jgi:hypothetical protein